jgi:hypothetical protein
LSNLISGIKVRPPAFKFPVNVNAVIDLPGVTPDKVKPLAPDLDLKDSALRPKPKLPVIACCKYTAAPL